MTTYLGHAEAQEFPGSRCWTGEFHKERRRSDLLDTVRLQSLGCTGLNKIGDDERDAASINDIVALALSNQAQAIWESSCCLGSILGRRDRIGFS
jgi:hypothetical protein